MKKRYLTIAFMLLVLSIPLYAIVNGQPLTEVLKDLRSELKMVYEKSAEEQALFNKDYDLQHQRMINVITASNELSLLLYTQEQGMWPMPCRKYLTLTGISAKTEGRMTA